MMATIRRKRAGQKVSSAAEHTAQAAADLGSAVSRMAAASGTYAGTKAKKVGRSVTDSDAAQQVRDRTQEAGDAGKEAVHRWRKRGRRLATAALIAAVAFVAQQVRSQPVPPDLERY